MTDAADLLSLLPLLAGPLLILSILVYAAMDTNAMQKTLENEDDEAKTRTPRAAID